MDDSSEQISIQEIAGALWHRRYLLILVTVLCTAVASAVAFLLPVKYQATVVLVPASDESGGRLGGAGALLSQFGGLAALSGVNVSGSGRKVESMATLQSAALTEAFIAERDLLPILYANKWDPTAKRWTVSDAEDIPTLWKAERMFRKKVRSINDDKKSGVITLTIEWTDAAQAADWANDLVARVNRSLRDRAIDSARNNLGYLSEQVSKTSIVELQKAIYELIEAEIKKIMIAQGSSEYAFRVIDPARVPELRSSPKRLLIVVAGFLAGLGLGSVLILLDRSAKRS